LAEFGSDVVDVAVAPSVSHPRDMRAALLSVRWITTAGPDANDDVVHVTIR
jgi:hypothetical protein